MNPDKLKFLNKASKRLPHIAGSLVKKKVIEAVKSGDPYKLEFAAENLRIYGLMHIIPFSVLLALTLYVVPPGYPPLNDVKYDHLNKQTKINFGIGRDIFSSFFLLNMIHGASHLVLSKRMEKIAKNRNKL
jgi:hypothetical protein